MPTSSTIAVSRAKEKWNKSNGKKKRSVSLQWLLCFREVRLGVEVYEMCLKYGFEIWFWQNITVCLRIYYHFTKSSLKSCGVKKIYVQ